MCLWEQWVWLTTEKKMPPVPEMIWHQVQLFFCCTWSYTLNFVYHIFCKLYGLCGLPCVSDSKECTCNAGDLDSILGLGRSPGEGHGNPLQFSCLENPMNRGAWWATVCRFAKIPTRLKWLSVYALAMQMNKSNHSFSKDTEPCPMPDSVLWESLVLCWEQRCGRLWSEVTSAVTGQQRVCLEEFRKRL